MTSKRQKAAGFLLPDPVAPPGRLCVSFEIPAAEEYVYATIGHIYQLSKWWIWEKSYTEGDTRARDAAALWRELLNETLRIGDCSGGNGMFQLRQNGCILEQSTDGGQTWTVAFDYELCALGDAIAADYVSWQQVLTNDQTEIDARRARYDGTPQSIHPSAPSVVPDNNAACAAALQWVECMLYYALNTRRVALGLASLAAGALGLLGGIPGVNFGALVVGTLAIDLAALESAVQDRSAIEQMACRLKDALKGDALSYTSFKADIAALAANTDNEVTIKNVLVAFADREENYWQYLATLGTAVDVAQAQELHCPCGGWCYEWDLTLATQGWQPAYFSSYPSIPLAVYEAGLGFCVNMQGVTHIANENVAIKINLPVTARVNSVRVRLANQMAAVGGYPALLVADSTTSRPLPASWERYQTGGTNWTQWAYTVSEAWTINKLTICLTRDRIQSSGYWPVAQNAYINSVQFKGYGVNPFGENNCTW